VSRGATVTLHAASTHGPTLSRTLSRTAADASDVRRLTLLRAAYSVPSTRYGPAAGGVGGDGAADGDADTALGGGDASVRKYDSSPSTTPRA